MSVQGMCGGRTYVKNLRNHLKRSPFRSEKRRLRGSRYIDITNLLGPETSSSAQLLRMLRVCNVAGTHGNSVRKNFRKYALSCYLFPRARNSAYNMLRRNIVGIRREKKNICTFCMLNFLERSLESMRHNCMHIIKVQIRCIWYKNIFKK